jgi:hypothetical protein
MAYRVVRGSVQPFYLLESRVFFDASPNRNWVTNYDRYRSENDNAHLDCGQLLLLVGVQQSTVNCTGDVAFKA